MTPSAPAGGGASSRFSPDTLIRAGAVVFGAGFVAVLAVIVVSDAAVAEALVVVALTLVPLGFCLAAAGFLAQVRARVRRSRPGTS